MTFTDFTVFYYTFRIRISLTIAPDHPLVASYSKIVVYEAKKSDSRIPRFYTIRIFAYTNEKASSELEMNSTTPDQILIKFIELRHWCPTPGRSTPGRTPYLIGPCLRPTCLDCFIKVKINNKRILSCYVLVTLISALNGSKVYRYREIIGFWRFYYKAD